MRKMKRFSAISWWNGLETRDKRDIKWGLIGLTIAFSLIGLYAYCLEAFRPVYTGTIDAKLEILYGDNRYETYTGDAEEIDKILKLKGWDQSKSRGYAFMIGGEQVIVSPYMYDSYDEGDVVSLKGSKLGGGFAELITEEEK